MADNSLAECLELDVQYETCDPKRRQIPVVVQQFISAGEIYRLGYANHELMQKTLETKSPSLLVSPDGEPLEERGLKIIEARVDCDQDAAVCRCAGNAKVDFSTLGRVADIRFDERGLVPAIVQDWLTGEVLMLGYANAEALEKTVNTKYATFWSRSRQKLWKKGGTSGDVLLVEDIMLNADRAAVIYAAKMMGNGACHTENSKEETRRTCFYRRITDEGGLKFISGMK